LIAFGSLDASGALRVQRNFSGLVSSGEVFMLQGLVSGSSGLRLSSPFVHGVGLLLP
jgi:hypothetical protein